MILYVLTIKYSNKLKERTMDTEGKIIEEITNIKDNIIEECQKELYDDYKFNSLVYQKIFNASNMLFNNALRINRKQSSLIKCLNEDITLKTTKNILQKIFKVVLSFEMAPKKENMIIKVLNEYNIDENVLLRPTTIYRNHYAFS
jgi:hypothetical protein